MKIAIIGAGVAGMACAYELERHGIFPDIYEQRHRPGDMFDHCAGVLEIFTRPKDPIKNLQEEFNISINPIAVIKAIEMKSPQKKVTVRGKNLGYFFLRGHDPASVESQLYKKLQTPVITNTRVQYSQLAQSYDYVIVANGSNDASKREGISTPIIQTMLIGGIVIGRFDVNTLSMWVDNRYAKKCYAYMCPIEEKRAFLGLVVNDSTFEEAREKWKLFWDIEQHPYDQVNEIVVEHIASFVYPHQVGNILFVGIAGGFQEPFLGFGLSASVKSGILAARSIVYNQKYEDLLFQLKKDMEHSIMLRNELNKAENKHLDILLKAISIPPLKRIIYNTNIDWIRIGTSFLAKTKKIFQKN